tara:strand:+ start:309 stop:488 length:180 start_codon:yes stop_codon:yes gene_type:complete
MSELEELYGPAIVVNSEATRCKLVSCRKCGATVMIDPLDVTPLLIHLEWHKAQEKKNDN